MLQIKNIIKSFTVNNQTFKAVNNVTLNIQKNDIFGIVGASGAGKSTLIRAINQLESIDSGSIEVNGTKVNLSTKEELRHFRMQTGMIFQHFNLLWSRTVRENITLPLEIAGVNKQDRIKRVDELLKIVELEDKEHSYPSQLSGGQKQRVGIARALANNCELLLCDEATSALDPETTKKILNLLKRINKELNITIVLITHELDLIEFICNKVAIMKHGEVIKEGYVKDINLNDGELYA